MKNIEIFRIRCPYLPIWLECYGVAYVIKPLEGSAITAVKIIRKSIKFPRMEIKDIRISLME